MTAALPEGWREVRLGDVCDTPRYGANAPARPFDPALPRYVRITDITDGGSLRTSDVRSAEPEKVQGHELHAGDLLFARSGSVGRTYLYRPEDGPCVYAGYLIRFRPDPEMALPRFVDIYTHSPSYYRWVESVLHVGAQPNINAAEYSSLPLLLPPLPEQRAIAAVLDSIDEAIERTEEVIAATERLRDALLHELLTRGLPGHHTAWRDVPGLGAIPACWEVVRLRDVASFITSGSRAWSEHFSKEGALFVRSQNIIGGKVDGSDAIFVRPPADAEAERTRIGVGDLLISITGEPGKVTVADDALGEAYVSQHVALVRLNQRDRSGFLATFLRGPRGQEQFQRSSYGQTRPGLNLSNVGSVRLALPPLPEQRAIAGTLDSVDAAIEGARAERAALQSSKASTADALLTGRVRVG